MAPRSLIVAEPSRRLRRRLRSDIRRCERDLVWLEWLVGTTLTSFHEREVTKLLDEHRKTLVELRAALTKAGGESDA